MTENKGGGESSRPSEPLALTEKAPAVPKVIYEGDINKPDSPSFRINASLLGKLLVEQGIPPAKIRDLRVFVFGRGAVIPEFLSILNGPDVVGTVSPEIYEANAIGINVENLCRVYADLKALLYKQIGGDPDHLTSMNRKFLSQLLVNSNKVLRYLEKAPSDRAMGFLDRFVEISIKRLFRLITIHELRHLRDRYDKVSEAKVALIGIVTGLPFALIPKMLTGNDIISTVSFAAVGLPLAGMLMKSYIEHRANRGLTEYTNDPRWLDIVEFTPPAE